MLASSIRSGFLPLAQRLWQRLWLFLAVCVSVASFLSLLAGGRFGSHLLYSLAIGSCCWMLTELGRSAVAQAAERLRIARGLPASGAPEASLRATLLPLLLAVMLGAPLGLWIGDLLTGNRSPSLLEWNSLGSRITLGVTVMASLVVVLGSALSERLSAARALAESAQRLASENQLRLLQAQLEPHMLFNTLANLRVLIGLDPAAAQAMLDRLIAFLRTTLEATRSGNHTLAQEFDHLADYLALLQMRMGPRLQVRLDLPQELRRHEVPALLLQPLVENAIRHGLEPKIAGGRVEVSAHRDGARLRLCVRDTGVGLAQATGTTGSRFGLQQIKERLNTLYGQAAALHIADAEDAEGGVLVTLTLPLGSETQRAPSA